MKKNRICGGQLLINIFEIAKFCPCYGPVTLSFLHVVSQFSEVVIAVSVKPSTLVVLNMLKDLMALIHISKN